MNGFELVGAVPEHRRLVRAVRTDNHGREQGKIAIGKGKQPQQAAKEIWPGAGLRLDWRKITGDDFDKKSSRAVCGDGRLNSKAGLVARLRVCGSYV